MQQYRREIFLINKKFQLRFAAYVCVWLLAISFVYPVIIYNLFDFFVRNASKLTALNMSSTRNEILWMLGFFQAIFLTITFIMSIFLSHRIAGPLYKLTLFFRAGDPTRELFFRKADHFHELAVDYNHMMHGIRDRMDHQISCAADAISQIERAMEQADPSTQERLRAAIASLREIDISKPT